MQVARVLKEAIEEGKSKADLEARPSPVTCKSIKKKRQTDPNRFLYIRVMSIGRPLCVRFGWLRSQEYDLARQHEPWLL